MTKGFTLIELLIVIAVLAVLATVVVLVLNPAQLLAEARDGQRFSDLAAVRDGIVYYLATVSNPTIGSIVGCTAAGTTGFNGTPACGTTGVYAVDGSGWVDVALNGATGGSPLATLPRDPTNTASYFYSYVGENTNKTFELNAKLESTRYLTTEDKDGEDGGDNTAFYEVGSNLDL
jgi:prepilin-type N-terminal cleavage/methylation domain-containing protein